MDCNENQKEHATETKGNQKALSITITTEQATLEADGIESNDPVIEEDVLKEEPYTVFTPSQLIRFLMICALTGMISPLTASIYMPALNQVQQDLQTTTEHVNLTITVYMIFQAISPTFWGTIADSYGRRPVLMSTMIVYCCACIGLALSPNYASLLIFRMLQAFGSSSVIAVGAGVLSDIVDSKRRGSYFGIYSIGQLLGPVLGPVLGGIIAQELGWRWIFWVLVMIGGLSFLCVGLFVHETLRSLVGNGSGYANPTPFQWIARRRGKLDEVKIAELKERENNSSSLNFFAPFIYLTEPDILTMLLLSGALFTSYYCFLTSTTKQFSIHYHLNELQIGLCFLCQGIGTILGSYVKGKLLDRDFQRLTKKMREEMQPDVEICYYHARLKTCWISLLFADITPIAYGWAMQYNAPLAVALILQFIAGFSISSITICVQSLIIDLFPGKGASITASNNLVRCILGAIATVCIEPGIEGVGIGWMFTILGFFILLFNSCVPILLKYGPRWKQRRAERNKFK
ncbi:major facilitator superfamily domain-containing protein [Cokeromyces recurvatus]|uniref:major facilitator superfamily domain-containing protein n=1 Tax=Cokeromyces recurvatus TaxID=90255 RepID=UPI00221EFA2A|nr:major facilitator superfamily domain-containing protein [Cokeromyces recurvatus]KAI7900288.1 major facilitator superfamily domain-containing protein [Cokeromyces recurvatus]